MKYTERELTASLARYCEASPGYLGDNLYGDTNLNITEGLMLYGLDGDTTFTLPSQMGELGFGTQTIPDVLAVTLDSAIPIADVLRGIYTAAEKPTPKIIGIKACKATSCVWNLLKGSEENLLDAAEIDRLAPLVSGKKVTVVDEYVASGGSLRYAEALLEHAGAQAINTVVGRWYENVRISDLVYEGFSSRYADRLKDIGAKAYRQYINQNI